MKNNRIKGKQKGTGTTNRTDSKETKKKRKYTEQREQERDQTKTFLDLMTIKQKRGIKVTYFLNSRIKIENGKKEKTE